MQEIISLVIIEGDDIIELPVVQQSDNTHWSKSNKSSPYLAVSVLVFSSGLASPRKDSPKLAALSALYLEGFRWLSAV